MATSLTRGWGVRPAALVAVAVRPALWGTAVRSAARLAAPGWWRSWPPRPAPLAGTRSR